MKRLIYLVVGTALVFAGYTFIDNKRAEAFAEVMETEFAGYRLEHFEQEKLLFLHAPDGSKQGMPLDRKCIEEVALMMTPAAENSTNKDLYRWHINYVMELPGSSPGFSPYLRRSFYVPYFAVEPAEFLALVKKAVPELDVPAALKAGKSLEGGECSSPPWDNRCVVWSRPGHSVKDEITADVVCTP